MGVEEVAGQMHFGLQIRAFEPEHAQVSRETSMNCDRHHGTKWLVSHHQLMDGEILKYLCPSCGKPMGLTRTVPATPGYSELRTFGCGECGVWVTEGNNSRDQGQGAFVTLK